MLFGSDAAALLAICLREAAAAGRRPPATRALFARCAGAALRRGDAGGLPGWQVGRGMGGGFKWRGGRWEIRGWLGVASRIVQLREMEFRES